ncbi:MAG: hypothetical protein EZS28_011215 [Streblomastix strix]|uniref:Uncharacterized protein n=1 Tax=Streblomastix strix TaxID=222440 RepID=A0A5J4WEC8_9EUKA|nr:MAG: hypothetical protein EZS28_011215 [Streblomastix strix]
MNRLTYRLKLRTLKVVKVKLILKLKARLKVKLKLKMKVKVKVRLKLKMKVKVKIHFTYITKLRLFDDQLMRKVAAKYLYDDEDEGKDKIGQKDLMNENEKDYENDIQDALQSLLKPYSSTSSTSFGKQQQSPSQQYNPYTNNSSFNGGWVATAGLDSYICIWAPGCVNGLNYRSKQKKLGRRGEQIVQEDEDKEDEFEQEKEFVLSDRLKQIQKEAAAERRRQQNGGSGMNFPIPNCFVQ